MPEETQDVGFKPVADDPNKSCKKCKNYAQKEGFETGDCFGHEVPEEGTCNFFETKGE